MRHRPSYLLETKCRKVQAQVAWASWLSVSIVLIVPPIVDGAAITVPLTRTVTLSTNRTLLRQAMAPLEFGFPGPLNEPDLGALRWGTV
jgi:hypothetical protein